MISIAFNDTINLTISTMEEIAAICNKDELIYKNCKNSMKKKESRKYCFFYSSQTYTMTLNIQQDMDFLIDMQIPEHYH